QVKKSRINADVLALPIQVAAFLTPTYILRRLKELNIDSYNLILVPGMIKGSVAEISKSLGVAVFKGPKHAVDLPLILENIDKLRLSTVKPACELLGEKLKKVSLKKCWKAGVKSLRFKGKSFSWENVWTFSKVSPVIMAEIVDAPSFSKSEVLGKAKKYVKDGADIVDVGMEAGDEKPEKAYTLVKLLSKNLGKPISIDTVNVSEIKAAVKAGVNLILSVNGENVKKFSKDDKILKTPVVVTPVAEDGSLPKNYVERIKLLEENIYLAKKFGFSYLIADPVLTINNFVDSVLGYFEFRRRNPEIPMLFGVGNITELVDADSQGLNFLLTLLAFDVKANIILTTEASNKTKGSVFEVSTAIKMILAAKNLQVPPKNLGIDLLKFKEKTRKDEDILKEELKRWKSKAFLVKVNIESEGYARDPRGYFKIYVDEEKGKIVVFYFSYDKNKPPIILEGSNPAVLGKRIVKEGLISSLDHAIYLGSELQKANIALKTGRSYLQDFDVF
ncbi:MAG: dihydropteroate synthase-like protein, partial [Candidatus Bathyarchaeota archaeon]|nr:dihydropteroate synthase-like protein [Candidatus Bathyarchaeota archaeon]